VVLGIAGVLQRWEVLLVPRCRVASFHGIYSASGSLLLLVHLVYWQPQMELLHETSALSQAN